jgi:DNA-binding beta-propeller fold protein YncE
MFSRRELLAGSAVFAAGCGRKRATGYRGYAFVANEEGGTISAVDLTSFSVAGHIALEGHPSSLVVSWERPVLYALTPDNGTVHEIDTKSLKASRKIQVAATAAAMRMDPGGAALWILLPEMRQLARLDLAAFRVDARISLPLAPVDFDLSQYFGKAAVSYGAEGSFSLADLASRSVGHPRKLGKEAGVVRFRLDGRQVLVGSAGERLLSVVDTASQQLVVQLPLAVEPRYFCYNVNGGQLFISGPGMDAVVVVFPYDTQVVETVLAGHAPGFLAASPEPEYLFVTNPASGEVTILSIDSRKAIAVTRVGSEPSFVAITPDNQYALVLNRASGDMAVIRIAAITAKRTKTAPLFTMIPVGSRPVSAAVRSA